MVIIRNRKVSSMSTAKPRHPVVIIGAGIAGLAAGYTLLDAGIPHLIIERFTRPGGRMCSREGDGWIADHGAQYLRFSDATVMELIRKVGMEQRRVMIQGGIHHLTRDRKIVVPRGGGIETDRFCIDYGFNALLERLAADLEVRYGTAVSAVRWDNDDKVFWWDKEGQVFWFEDENGEPLINPVSQEIVLASAVILATTPTVAHAIAKQSRSLADLVPLLGQLGMDSTFTGIFKVPRQEGTFYALRGERESAIQWLAFEDRKAPERIDPQYSLLLVQANPDWSENLIDMEGAEAMAELYAEARRVLPSLPELPISQTHKKWNVSQLATAPLGQPWERGLAHGRWPVNPEHAPFALAGDYIHGSRAEDAARSGIEAAKFIMTQLPKRRSILGLEIPA